MTVSITDTIYIFIYMNKRLALLTASFVLVTTLFVMHTRGAYAACECVRYAHPGGDVYDNQGNRVPPDAFGLWKSTPLGSPEDPRCPDLGCPANELNKITPLCEDKPCNVYTQGFVRTWFRVPTLGDLIGNALRLLFFIAGLYALVLLLLGGFEWVSSGGEDKKLESARKKIINAIIGLVVMVAVLTLVILIEQVVFGGKVCLGISCPIDMGSLSIIK